MFAFKENNKTTYVISKELLEIYKKEYTLEFRKNLDKENVKKYFFTYGMMNGIIEKDWFINLLKDNYKMNLSVKEIENIIKENHGNIYKSKYYSVLNVDLEDNIDLLIEQKEESNLSYKILDEEKLNYYMMMINTWLNKLSKIIKIEKNKDSGSKCSFKYRISIYR